MGKKIKGAAWKKGRQTVYRKGKAAKYRKAQRKANRQLASIKRSLSKSKSPR